MKMRAVVIALAWAGMLAGLGQVAGQASSQTAGPIVARRPMTFADLMAMKRVSDPQIAPSGKWVMFSVTDVSLQKNMKVNHLWVVPIDGSAPEKQVTFGDGESFGRFSPDGKFVSYTGAPTKDDRMSRSVVATWDEKTGTIGVGRTLTAVSGDADGAIWSPDSKRLVFVADVYPECSDKPTWAEEDACDKAKDDAAAASPVKAQVWGALFYRHWDHYTGEQRSHILVVDADGKNVRDLTPASVVGTVEVPTFFLGAPLEYAWAPDSREIAYVAKLDKVPAASTNNDIFTLRLDEPGAKAVKVSTSLGSDDEPEYSPDGKWLAFRPQERAGFESDRFRLMLSERIRGLTGQQVGGREWSEPRELIPRMMRPAGAPYDNWVDEFAWVPDSVAIVFVSGEEGRESVFSANVVKGSFDNSMLIRLSSDGEYGDIQTMQTRGRDKGMDQVVVVATKTTVQSPNEVVSIEAGSLGHTAYDYGYGAGMKEPEITPGGGSSKQLTHLNDALLSQLSLSPLEPFWFVGAEGTKVEGFIVKPPGFDASKKYPVKFIMHGGPQTAEGDIWSYRWNWELMAASGYVVVGINRRGSTGYGQKFVDEVSGDWGGRAYVDLMKGLDYAEATYPFIDKTRECALGASYGGYMADWVLTHTNRFKCIVTHDGMFDPVSAYGSTEEMWFNEWEFRRPEDFPKGWDGFAPDARQTPDGHAAEPWRYQNLPADQDPFREWSPMRFIENAKTPTLIIHSQKDYRLDVSQGFELFTALQRLGVPSKMLYFPDEGHWVLKPQNSQLWYETVGDWCDRRTKSGKYAETKSGKSAGITR